MDGPQPNGNDQKKEDPVPTVFRLLPDGTAVELLYDPDRRRTEFAVSNGSHWSVESEITVTGERLVPFSPRNNLIKNEAVLLPSRPLEYGTDQELLGRVQSHIHRYADLSPSFERLAAHYVLLSWVYDAFNELPYLRLRGDYGTGKTRALLTIGSVCCRPFFASGASTISPIFHTLNAFCGTLVFDEADFRFSDERAEIVKVLNNGNVRGMPVLRTMLNRQREFNPQAFQVFGPKIVATRRLYDDKGLESRFITEEMGGRALRTDIPINLPLGFNGQARELRNMLLLYRFRHLGRVRLDESLVDSALEPRLNQILLPLLSLIDDPKLRSELRSACLETQCSAIFDRSLTLEARALEVLLELNTIRQKKMVPVGHVTARVIDRFGAEYSRPITNRWIGSIIRERLGLRTHKSNGVYVVSLDDKVRLRFLCARYGIEAPEATLRDVGSSVTS